MWRAAALDASGKTVFSCLTVVKRLYNKSGGSKTNRRAQSGGRENKLNQPKMEQ